MDAHEKLWQLFERLEETTRSGSLTWEEAGVNEAFQVVFPSYIVRIRPAMSDRVISIHDDEGDLIEEASDVDLNVASGFESFRRMNLLLEMARRQARGADQAIDSILDFLGDDG